MRTLLEYIERAKLRAEPQNYDGLAGALGVSKNSIYLYKSGEIYPSEDVMILLGIMADVQPGQAIIDLMNIKALAKSNEKLIRRVSIINEHLGIDDNEYKQSKSQQKAIWNTR
ncbi:MAG TPA: hypothetical protein VFS88_05325 [Micavibrio sp.]|nr:hypothetical protein [Micavibrio sp.]